MDQNWDIVLFHTYKEGNKTADFLAKMACTQSQDIIILESPHMSMENLLQ